MHKIMIVEDDAVIASQMERHLHGWGFAVTVCTDFQAVMDTFEACAPHLVLLDVSLPFFNGYHWCGEIRRRSKVPVIFVSSAADNMNIVMAMNMGADDFIAKPFDLNVLTAKVQALLRRAYEFAEEVPTLACGDVLLDLGTAALQYGGSRIDLTKNEFRILQALLERTGQVVSREDIMARLWDDDSFIDDNTLTVNVNRLRKKLEDHGLRGFIRTKKGLGYFIEGTGDHHAQ